MSDCGTGLFMKNLLWRELCGGSDFSAVLCADFVLKARKAPSRPASRRAARSSLLDGRGLRPGSRIMPTYLRLRVALLDRVVRLFDGDCEVRFVRDAVRPRRTVDRPVLLRRVERAVLRDGLRRFVAVLPRLVDLVVDLRVVALRDVDPRADDLPVDDLPADDLRADDLRVVLRLAVLRLVVFRPDVLAPDVLRPEDAAVLPAPSRRFVRARLRLFFAGLS
jgi:hypothetical protein